jgi:hypothetical protein
MKIYYFLILLVLGSSVQSCLPLAEDFKYTPKPRNGDMKMSAWEFIKSRPDFAAFDTLIRVSGIDTMLYARKDTKYTYLLLNEGAVGFLLVDKYPACSITTLRSTITDDERVDLKNRLLYHIINGYYFCSKGGNLTFDVTPVTTLWDSPLSKMVLKLNKNSPTTASYASDGMVGINSYLNAAVTDNTANTSNLFVTNGVMMVLNKYASYDRVSY